MIVGVPKETKADEQRVSLLPVEAHMLVQAGHSVYVQQGATDGSGVPIEDYMEAGAFVVDTAAEVIGTCQRL
jgi:alanine dehydrogenase